jgi:hypothetical protein
LKSRPLKDWVFRGKKLKNTNQRKLMLMRAVSNEFAFFTTDTKLKIIKTIKGDYTV